ncbi:MAG: DUF4911 domain-containing protein [Negativicutes bacterium]|jgi:putative protease
MSVECIIKLFVSPENINFFNRIIEGYSHLGTLTTVDSKSGMVFIRCTPDTIAEVELIVDNLPFVVKRIGEC